ncbi:acetyl-CoA synthetase-like protein [Trichodelitschia bisporula]|uniref:Acetyl-CoA synthetase-like protein n=1 Tax=Trichodelitschia bisporula TaxID=703511 RepID=A0A6G1HPS9_9PEZI|nr:acetyl-CoA synthetase-like protein [Trichodelitschia bisporula]
MPSSQGPIASERTIAERVGNQTIYRADIDIPIPELDVLSFLFDNPGCNTRSEDAPVHIDAANPENRVTKAQARDLVRRIAHALRTRFGVGNGTIVTALSTGSYVLPNVFYGVVAAEGVYSAVPASATVEELVRFVKGAPSEIIICSDDVKPTALEAARVCGIPMSKVLVIDAGAKPALRVADTGENVLGNEILEWPRLKGEKLETPVCLVYSSGTTGLPKGVTLNHCNMVAECVIAIDQMRSQMDHLAPDMGYRTLGHLPTAHIAGMQGYFINPFYAGGPTYWMAKFDFAKFLEYMKRYQITCLFTVPPIYLLIAKSPVVTDQLVHLRHAIAGAAPLGKELQMEASRKLGGGKTFIVQTWGLSESTGSATLLNFQEQDDTGSIGRLLPSITARLVDDNDVDAPPNTPGEILLKGPIIFRSYHRNPTATNEAFTPDGWFRTGDVGVFRDGLFYIIDRKKELIKYKGLQVAPAELEDLLVSHPLILDAAVIGVPQGHTEVPRAYVVADRSKISAAEIEAFVKDRLASYKQLRGGVVFLDAIPKSPSGKIMRKDLRELAKKESRETGAKL